MSDVDLLNQELQKQEQPPSAALMQDPEKAKATGVLSRSLGLPAGYVWQNMDKVSKAVYGKSESAPSLWNRLEGTYNQFKIGTERANIATRKMFGNATQADMQRDEELKKQQETPEATLGSVPTGILQSLAGLGYMGVKGAQTLSSTAAAIVASANVGAWLEGKNPAKVSWQAAKGSANAFLGTLAGGLYSTMRDRGVSPEVARGVGAGMLALNAVTMALPISKIPGVSQLLDGAVSEAASRAAVKGGLDTALAIGGKFAGRVAEIGAYNTAYATANAIAPELAVVLNNRLKGTNLPTSTFKDIMSQIGLQATTSTIVMGALGAPDAIMEGGALAKELRAAADRAKAHPEELSSLERIPEGAPGTVAGEGLGTRPRAATEESGAIIQTPEKVAQETVAKMPISEIYKSPEGTELPVGEEEPVAPESPKGGVSRPISEATGVPESTQPYELQETPTERRARQADEHLNDLESKIDTMATANKTERAAYVEALKSAREEAKLTAQTVRTQTKEERNQFFAVQKAKRIARVQTNRMIQDIQGVDTSKMRPEFAEPVKEIQDAFDPRRMGTKTLDRLHEIMDSIEADPMAELSEDDKAILNRAAKKPLRDLTLDELTAVHNQVMYFDKLQRESTKIMVLGKQIERTEAINSIRTEMPKPEKVAQDLYRISPSLGERVKVSGQKVRNFFGDHMMGLDFLAKTIGGKEDSTFYRSVFKAVHGDGLQEYDSGEVGALKYAQGIDDAQSKARKGLLEKVRNIDAWRSQSVTTGRFHLTRDERIAMWMLWNQEASRKNLTEQGFGSRFRGNRNEVLTPGEAQYIELMRSITPEEKEAAAALGQGFRQIGQDVGAQHLRVKNYPMETVENYFPIDVMPVSRKSSSEAETGLELAKGKFARIGLPKGRTISRTGAVKPIYVRGAFEVFAEHRDWASAYIHVDQPLLNAARVLDGVRSDIESRWGEPAYNELENRLRKVAGSVEKDTGLERAMLLLRGNYISSALALNPISIAANLMNVERFCSSGLVPARHLGLGLADSLLHPIQVHRELKTWSPEYRAFHAEGAFNKDIREALRTRTKNTPVARMGRSFRQIVQYPSRLTDRIAVRAGMRGAFFRANEEISKAELSPDVSRALGLTNDQAKGLSGPEQIAHAYRYAEYALEHVNSVPLASLQAGLHLGNWFEQTLGSFGSDAVRAQQLFRESLRNLRTRQPKAFRRFAALTAGLFLVEPLHYVLLNYYRQQEMAKRKPPSAEAFKEAFSGSDSPRAISARRYAAFVFVDQAMYYFPVIRDIGIPAAAAITHQYSANSLLLQDELVALSSRTIGDASKWASAKNDREKEKYLNSMADNGAHLTAALTGIPYSAPKMYAKLGIEAAEGK